MKKLMPLLLIIVLSISCEKVNDNGIRYSQAQLNGVWKSTETSSFNCVKQFEFTDSVLSEINVCAGVPLRFKADDYSFNGKIFKYKLYGLEHEYEISELTDEILIIGYNDPIKYIRVSK